MSEIRTKWFYALQKKLSAYLNDNYLEYQCLDQIVTKNTVYEKYTVFYNDEKGNLTAKLIISEMEYNEHTNSKLLLIYAPKLEKEICLTANEN